MDSEHIAKHIRLQHLSRGVFRFVRFFPVLTDQLAADYHYAVHGLFRGGRHIVLLRSYSCEFERPRKRVLEHRFQRSDPRAVTSSNSRIRFKITPSSWSAGG